MKIVAINIGSLNELNYNGKPEMTGLYKQPSIRPVFLTKTGFIGDQQADLKHHGGMDKAVCVYSVEHYTYWQTIFPKELPPAAFGENLTVQNMLETEIHLGDIFQIGEAVVQVTQPRQPCYKLIWRYHMKELPVYMQNRGYTGYYFRVLQEGQVALQDEIVCLVYDTHQISIQFANQIMHHDTKNMEGIKKILAVDALSDSWRTTLTKRLKGQATDTSERLQGK